METTVYLIFGHTGVYDDKYEWFVKVFHDQDKAKTLLNQLNTICDKIVLYDYGGNEPILKELEVLDKRAAIDDLSGTYYTIEEGVLVN
jgi:hypothetical protein